MIIMTSLEKTFIPRILIADDMATNRVMLTFAFKSTNFEIVEASSGEEALTRV